MPPEVGKMMPERFGLMTFWPWLHKSKNNAQQTRFYDFLALVPEVVRMIPIRFDLGTVSLGSTSRQIDPQDIRFEDFLALVATRGRQMIGRRCDLLHLCEACLRKSYNSSHFCEACLEKPCNMRYFRDACLRKQRHL